MEQQKPKTLTDLVKGLRGLLDEKDRLEAEAKKQEIIQQMLDDDTTRISCGGYVYTLQAKTASLPSLSHGLVCGKSPAVKGNRIKRLFLPELAKAPAFFLRLNLGMQ